MRICAREGAVEFLRAQLQFVLGLVNVLGNVVKPIVNW